MRIASRTGSAGSAAAPRLGLWKLAGYELIIIMHNRGHVYKAQGWDRTVSVEELLNGLEALNGLELLNDLEVLNGLEDLNGLEVINGLDFLNVLEVLNG
ncbi:hypothetical protein J6590_008267 [Homalodisca vitripennis]|nr:hypothetical protein J6590_008267 [Homalodisca vitripennis]